MSEIGKSVAANLTASAFRVSPLNPGTLQVTVGKGVSRENLHQIIDEIINLHGCMACGLGGLDLRIRPQDLVSERFQKIPEVKDVVVIR